MFDGLWCGGSGSEENGSSLTKVRSKMESGIREPNVAIEMRSPQGSTCVLTVFA
jgi:hypothetical protein